VTRFVFLILGFLGWAGIAAADGLCSRFNQQSYSRGWETVGLAPQGVTGFLANPGTERKLDGRGVWFAAGTHFIVYPMIRIGPRILVMSEEGVYAAIRPNALICLRGAQPVLETKLVEAAPIHVGRRSALHSVFQVNCNERQQYAREAGLTWEFAPVNIAKIGGSRKLSETVAYDGSFQTLVFHFRDPVAKERLKLTETQSCRGGAAGNDPRWQIEIGSAGAFTITREMLAQRGITSFDFFTGRPVVSCAAERAALIEVLRDAPIHDGFIPHVAGVIGAWRNFADFDRCRSTGPQVADLSGG